MLLRRAKINIPRPFSRQKVIKMVPDIPQQSIKMTQRFPEIPKIMKRNSSGPSLERNKNLTKEVRALKEILRRPPSQTRYYCFLQSFRDYISLSSNIKVKVGPTPSEIYSHRVKMSGVETKPATSFKKRRRSKPNPQLMNKLKEKTQRSAYTAFSGKRVNK